MWDALHGIACSRAKEEARNQISMYGSREAMSLRRAFQTYSKRHALRMWDALSGIATCCAKEKARNFPSELLFTARDKQCLFGVHVEAIHNIPRHKDVCMPVVHVL